MFCTHEEAKKKLCPPRFKSGGNYGVYCYGHECMAWEWACEEIINNEDYKSTTPVPRVIKRVPKFIKTDKGYCLKLKRYND